MSAAGDIAGERNDDLAYATLDHIREHPEEWNQRDYFCGTTACFAGRAALIALGDWDSVMETALDGYSEGEIVEGPDAMIHFRYSAALARDLLGWTSAEAATVFGLLTEDFTVLETAVKRVLNGELG